MHMTLSDTLFNDVRKIIQYTWSEWVAFAFKGVSSVKIRLKSHKTIQDSEGGTGAVW